MASRPIRTTNPASKLIDPNNSETAALSSHRRAVAHAQVHPAPLSIPCPITLDLPTTLQPQPHGSEQPLLTAAPQQQHTLLPAILPAASQQGTSSKHPLGETITSDDDEEAEASAVKSKKKRAKKKHRQEPNDLVDVQGMHLDVNVISIDDEDTTVARKPNPTADVKHFFKPALPPEHIPKGAKSKARSKCIPCIEGIKCAKQPNMTIHADTSTQRRHMEATHPDLYRKWARENGFQSMLPGDSKARREKASAEEQKLTQTHVEDHYNKKKPGDKPQPYTHTLWQEAAIQWLIETDQPVQAFEHPTYQKMIELAARSTQGVLIPNVKQTRRAIITTFKKQMKAMRDRMNDPSRVRGEISLTCDAWQASTADGYFAVTGHWIEVVSPNTWKLQHALLGFTRMNTAHDGVRLGQALFRICDRLGIVHRVGHITCDNAANNGTMLEEFAKQYQIKTGKEFPVNERHIRCLAHIINLATQTLISSKSKSKYYDPSSQDEHEVVVEGAVRDEVGLVRAICVKARSSAQRKEMFKKIQERQSVKPAQLLVDMKVRWGSTYVMLYRAESRRAAVDTFVYDLGLKEELFPEKRRKIDALKLRPSEWERVTLFCNLLSHADECQQSFSAVKAPTLHNALPAIEILHSAWTKAAGKGKYHAFAEPLKAATSKLDEYYQKTAASDAHIMAMVLHPGEKIEHFHKHWGVDLTKDVIVLVKAKFEARYKRMQATVAASGVVEASQGAIARASLSGKRRRTYDTDSDTESSTEPAVDGSGEFDRYLGTSEAVQKDVDIVNWWGLNASRYPTWASLAQDYLAVMASSVSSERAFSAAGITISKRRNRLKEDIVEALQCLKCMFHEDIIFREAVTAVDLEEQLDDTEYSLDGAFANAPTLHTDNPFSWDEHLVDDNMDEPVFVSDN